MWKLYVLLRKFHGHMTFKTVKYAPWRHFLEKGVLAFFLRQLRYEWLQQSLLLKEMGPTILNVDILS